MFDFTNNKNRIETTANNMSRNIVKADIYVLYAHHYKKSIVYVFSLKRKEIRMKKCYTCVSLFLFFNKKKKNIGTKLWDTKKRSLSGIKIFMLKTLYFIYSFNNRDINKH